MGERGHSRTRTHMWTHNRLHIFEFMTTNVGVNRQPTRRYGGEPVAEDLHGCSSIRGGFACCVFARVCLG